MNDTLSLSYRNCQREARRSGSSFYYSFFLLPRAKRRAMVALYAFLRHTDDLGDSRSSLEERQQSLRKWRDDLRSVLAGDVGHPLLTALAHTVREFSIPAEYLYAAIDGVEMDLKCWRYETLGELENYCYHVASVVGLACLHIWGFADGAALQPARQCGIAFQLTNILRDLWPDAAIGRLYLPLEDLRRCGCPLEGWPETSAGSRLRDLIQFEVARAKTYYEEAADLQHFLRPDGQRIFATMFQTYRELLRRIEKRDVELPESIHLSRFQKLWYLGRSWMAGPPRPKSLQKLAGATPE